MNKPSVKPPKGWRILKPRERVMIGDAVYNFEDRDFSCRIGKGAWQLGYTNGDFFDNSELFVRRRRPKVSLADELFSAHNRYLRGAVKGPYWRMLARAARRHIAREGKV